MRLRTKYAIVLLVILLVLGTVVGGSAELFKRQTIDQEQAEINETARLAAGQVDEAIGDQSDILQTLGADQDRRAAFLDSPETELGTLVDSRDFFIALLVAENGTILAVEGAISEQERENSTGQYVVEPGYLTEESVQLTLDIGRTPVEPVRPFANDDDFVIMMAAPLVSGQGGDSRIDGAIVGGLVVGPSGDSDVFSSLEPLGTDRQSVRVTGETIGGETATLVEPNREFNESLTSTATVESTGWQVTIERDRSALTSRIQFLQFIQLGSLVLVLLSVFGLGYYEYRTTLRQTNKLLTGFSELTDGNFEYSLSLESAEEWTQIGEGFNTMADGMREREQQIRERERRLSVLNRVLRHNLQNDLTVVQGYAEVLPTMDDREQREEASETILRKSRGLVDHGRKARRLETVMENAEEGPTKLELGGKVLDMVAEYERDYPEVAVEVSGPEQAWVEAVSGIEFGIEQLIDNAFEHNTSEDPTVSVTVEQTDGEVVVTVSDNGPGIPEHERDVLVQDEETSLEHGSGIGLWLAYWAVVKSGGDLSFGQQASGGQVTVRLPACDPPDDAETGDLLDF